MVNAALVLFSRPAAMIAVVAGFIVLSIIFAARRHVRKRTEAREKLKREARQLTGQFRRAPRMPKREDRLKAVSLAKRISDFTALHGFELHEVGISKTEMDRILYLVREDVIANPVSRHPNALHRVLNPKEPGTADIPINVAPEPTEEVLFTATFAEGELPHKEHAEEDEGWIEIEVVPPSDAEEVPCPWDDEKTEEMEMPAPPPSDPLQALRTTDQADIDAFLEERFAAIQETEDEQ